MRKFTRKWNGKQTLEVWAIPSLNGERSNFVIDTGEHSIMIDDFETLMKLREFINDFFEFNRKD